MVTTERLIFLYLVLFPFGQLLRLGIGQITIHPVDVIVALIFGHILLSKTKYPKIFNKFISFFLVSLFSLGFSLTIFEANQVMIGFLYLLRFVACSYLFVAAWQLSRQSNNLKKLIFESLIALGIFVAIFGWIQYFAYPDLTALVEFGWDDHLYRLTSTFLDPAYTGIIIVLASILVIAKFLKNQQKNLLVLALGLILTLAFTYSRSSYLCLLAGLLVLIPKKSIKIFPIIIAAFLILLILLPRPSSEGVKLERMHSVFLKIENYQQSLEIIKNSPLFGVGFNNICVAKQKYLGETEATSHACSGLDNSFLLILATSGVVGGILFLDLIIATARNTSKNFIGKAFLASGTAVIIHSLFTNTLFYPWVMGWLALLLGISRKNS